MANRSLLRAKKQIPQPRDHWSRRGVGMTIEGRRAAEVRISTEPPVPVFLIAGIGSPEVYLLGSDKHPGDDS